MGAISTARQPDNTRVAVAQPTITELGITEKQSEPKALTSAVAGVAMSLS